MEGSWIQYSNLEYPNKEWYINSQGIVICSTKNHKSNNKVDDREKGIKKIS